MRIEVELANVVGSREKNYFVAVQLQYDDHTTAAQKYRTDVAPVSGRPAFKRNLFTFERLIDRQTLKLGLMSCEGLSEQSVASGRLEGLASIILSKQRLKSLPKNGYSKVYGFMRKQKEIGQCECIIKVLYYEHKEQKGPKGSRVTRQSRVYNPLISRILYNEEATRDHMRMASNITELEKLTESMYKEFKALKGQEETLENIYESLEKDENELREEVEVTERINEKISLKMTQKQGLQPLKLEIDMLKNTEEGKRLLMQRLEYFDQRIKDELQEYQKLSQKYESIKEDINARIKRAENYAKKLKGKQMQQFEMHKNGQLLKRYQDVQYEFRCNEHIIQNLIKKQRKSQLTAEQAELLLSQVKFEIKVEEIEGQGAGRGDQLLNSIEAEAQMMGRPGQQTMAEEEKHILEIKLNAIREEIDRAKMRLQEAVRVAPSPLRVKNKAYLP